MKYCENCSEENLKDYIIDSLGSVFCNDNCFANSLEYRELNHKQVTIIQEIKVRARE